MLHSTRPTTFRAAASAVVLAATAGIGLTLAAPAVAAPASSCTADSLNESLKAATTVVVATLTAEPAAEPSASPTAAPSASPSATPKGEPRAGAKAAAQPVDERLEVVASRLYKGTVTDPRLSVVARAGKEAYWSGASDQKLLLLIDADGRADRCNGSRVADAATMEKVQTKLGVGERLAVPLDEVERTQLATKAPQDFARLAAPGAAVVLLALLGLAVVSRVQKH
ncbi:hypothetical protein [Nocardioides yefusunii]|uniref:TPM domain-containing protein n=1 Tax=Nocardioides yefusunii TaxID=2500546 RepID=A0ABW1R0V3_9ACTN|nr:hypothetical protein [Nocardioides yefusunii]